MAHDTAGTIERLGREKYLSLATHRRDGTERATPVWVVRDGDVLLVLTGASSAKVERARRNPSATVTPCDARGRVEPGAEATPVSVEVTSDPVVRLRVDQLLRRKHPVTFRLVSLARAVARLRPGGGSGGRSSRGLADEQIALRLRLRRT